jgi:hypothetical protein
MFHTESVDTESETDAGSASQVNSKYLQEILKGRKCHDSTFGIYQYDTDGFLEQVVQDSNIKIATSV